MAVAAAMQSSGGDDGASDDGSKGCGFGGAQARWRCLVHLGLAMAIDCGRGHGHRCRPVLLQGYTHVQLQVLVPVRHQIQVRRLELVSIDSG